MSAQRVPGGKKIVESLRSRAKHISEKAEQALADLYKHPQRTAAALRLIIDQADEIDHAIDVDVEPMLIRQNERITVAGLPDRVADLEGEIAALKAAITQHQQQLELLTNQRNLRLLNRDEENTA